MSFFAYLELTFAEESDMNLPKQPSSRRIGTSRSKKASDRAEVVRLKKELAAVTRERDGYRHAFLKQMQEESKSLDLERLRLQFCTGPEIDLIAQLKARLKAKKRS